MIGNEVRNIVISEQLNVPLQEVAPVSDDVADDVAMLYNNAIVHNAITDALEDPLWVVNLEIENVR